MVLKERLTCAASGISSCKDYMNVEQANRSPRVSTAEKWKIWVQTIMEMGKSWSLGIDVIDSLGGIG